MALIEQLVEGRYGMIHTVLLRTPEGNKITRPIQLVIPLEVDQGGRIWRNVFPLNTMWIIRPEVVVVVYLHVSSLTINYVCEQDGVPLLCSFVTYSQQHAYFQVAQNLTCVEHSRTTSLRHCNIYTTQTVRFLVVWTAVLRMATVECRAVIGLLRKRILGLRVTAGSSA